MFVGSSVHAQYLSTSSLSSKKKHFKNATKTFYLLNLKCRHIQKLTIILNVSIVYNWYLFDRPWKKM